MNELDDSDGIKDGLGGGVEGRGIVPYLEAAARENGAKMRPRMQSRREEEWIERLLARWGDDVAAMMRDRRLNPRQQSEGDLRRRIKIFRERRGAG